MKSPPRATHITNLYWFWRNCRQWDAKHKRKLLYEIHKEKVYLFTQGFTQAEIKQICKDGKDRNAHLFPSDAMLKLQNFNKLVTARRT